MKIFLIAMALIMGMAVPSMAQDMVELPDGHTVLNLSATENEEVDQDLLIASLRFEHEAKTARDVQNFINEKMAAAIIAAEAVSSLSVETGSYQVYPDYRNVNNARTGTSERVLDKWRGEQTLTVKSRSAGDVLELTGKLQGMGFAMNSLDYTLSPEKYEQVRDALMEKTIKALVARAERVGKALGKSEADFVEINVDAQQFGGPVYMRAAKMESRDMAMAGAPMAAPSATAGETTVSMTISARAVLKP